MPFKILLTTLLMLTLQGCSRSDVRPHSSQKISHFIPAPPPDWTKNATIYEVNLRQYTREGTFNAFRRHLTRLEKLGVDILWLMPIYPIGEERRKGGMGSPYSVRDYRATNPDMGTRKDFRALVKDIHRHGMKIILDWVPNHSAFDNPWITAHPEWYTKDENGQITHPEGTDWTDVADLNYDQPEMRKEMTTSMAYWVRQFDIDGFRCDVAGFVPNDFWKENNAALQNIKPLFLLAEWDDPALHRAGFHMTYTWGFHHLLNQLAKGEKKAPDVVAYMQEERQKFQPGDYRMCFTTNHDENTWKGSIHERMGEAGDAMNVLAFTLFGMPLIYSGQEAGLQKRLSFFEKDEIDWSDLSKSGFYQTLLSLKHRNPALWNGRHGAPAEFFPTPNKDLLIFTRHKAGRSVYVFINLSAHTQEFHFNKFENAPAFTNVFTDEIAKGSDLNSRNHRLGPRGFMIWEK